MSDDVTGFELTEIVGVCGISVTSRSIDDDHGGPGDERSTLCDPG